MYDPNCECGNLKVYPNAPACSRCMFLDGSGYQQAEILHTLLGGPVLHADLTEGFPKGSGGRYGAIQKLLRKNRIVKFEGEDEQIYYRLI